MTPYKRALFLSTAWSAYVVPWWKRTKAKVVVG